MMKCIDFDGYRYWYEYKLARHDVDICLGTTNPEEYCNGYYLYSHKDPGSGMGIRNRKNRQSKTNHKGTMTKPTKLEEEIKDQLFKALYKETIDDMTEFEREAVVKVMAEVAKKYIEKAWYAGYTTESPKVPNVVYDQFKTENGIE